MNRDEIWQQLKNDKSLVYGEPILDVFLKITRKITEGHYQELTKDQKKNVSAEIRLQHANTKEDAKEAIQDGAEDLEEAFVNSIKNNKTDIIKYFVEERGFFSFTALRVAGHKGDLKTIEYLINKKFSKDDLVDLKNASILPWKSTKKHERLGEAIAAILDGASQGGNLDVFKYFIEELGVKPEEIFEIPALELLDAYAISQNHIDILEYLSEKLEIPHELEMPREEKILMYEKYYLMFNKRKDEGGQYIASFFAKKLGQILQQ